MGSGKAQNQYDGTEAGYDHKDMQDMWQDVFPPGGGAALAGLLPGMPGEAPAGGDDHQDVPQMWAQLHIRILRPAMAQILPGLPGEAKPVTAVESANRFPLYSAIQAGHFGTG